MHETKVGSVFEETRLSPIENMMILVRKEGRPCHPEEAAKWETC